LLSFFFADICSELAFNILDWSLGRSVFEFSAGKVPSWDAVIDRDAGTTAMMSRKRLETCFSYLTSRNIGKTDKDYLHKIVLLHQTLGFARSVDQWLKFRPLYSAPFSGRRGSCEEPLDTASTQTPTGSGFPWFQRTNALLVFRFFEPDHLVVSGLKQPWMKAREKCG
jgi:hypothetical protein